MGKMEVRICDACELDGKGKVKAIGYYFAGNGEHYDVCKKHTEDVKEKGEKLYLFWRSK